jgi:hypothetical protein
MKYFLLILSFPVFAQVSMLTDKKLLDKTRADQRKLLTAISECKPFELQHSHPVITKNLLISKVHGLQKNQNCLYTQTLPHGALKTCHLSAQHRLTIKTKGQQGLNQLISDPKVCKDSGSNI